MAKVSRKDFTSKFLLSSRTGIPHLLRYVSDTGRLRATFGEVRPHDDFVIMEKVVKRKPYEREEQPDF